VKEVKLYVLEVAVFGIWCFAIPAFSGRPPGGAFADETEMQGLVVQVYSQLICNCFVCKYLEYMLKKRADL
jgi:hypothetical protein